MQQQTKSTDNLYPTTDSTLSAYLHSQGFLLDHVDTDSFPTVFLFQKSPKLQELVSQFQKGEAIGNVIVYQRSYKYILSLVPHKTNKR